MSESVSLSNAISNFANATVNVPITQIQTATSTPNTNCTNVTITTDINSTKSIQYNDSDVITSSSVAIFDKSLLQPQHIKSLTTNIADNEINIQQHGNIPLDIKLS